MHGAIPATAAARETVHRHDLQLALQHGEPGRLRPADVRGLARVQVPGRRQVTVRPPFVAHGRLRDDAVLPSLSAMRMAQGRRQQPRLLAWQHEQAGALVADEPRGQVQGQAGGRLVLRPHGRRAAGSAGLRRRAAGPRVPRSRGSTSCWPASGSGSSCCSIGSCAPRRRRQAARSCDRLTIARCRRRLAAFRVEPCGRPSSILSDNSCGLRSLRR